MGTRRNVFRKFWVIVGAITDGLLPYHHFCPDKMVRWGHTSIDLNQELPAWELYSDVPF